MGFGSVSASMGHSGFDYNASSLTGKKHLVRETTVETSGPPGKRRRVTVRSRPAAKNTLNTSGNRHEDVIYDKALLTNQGPQRLTALVMNGGKRLGHVDRIGRFLGNLKQNGRVVSSWNGCLHSAIDARTVCMQFFRHRFSANGDGSGTGNIKQTQYPQEWDATRLTFLPQILYPNNSAFSYGSASGSQQGYDVTNPARAIQWKGGADPNNISQVSSQQQAPAPGDIVHNAFYDHACGTTQFAVINRPDLEDMSWNLNKLKLKQVPLQAGCADDLGLSATFTGSHMDLRFNGTSVIQTSGAPALQANTSGADVEYPLTHAVGNIQMIGSGATQVDPVPSGTVAINGNPWHNDVQEFCSASHRRQSVVQQNNFYNVTYPQTKPSIAKTNPRAGASTYTYLPVLRYGTIKYEFMNKDDTGCTIEAILYRVKKTHLLSSDAARYTAQGTLEVRPEYTDSSGSTIAAANLSCQYPLNTLVDAIGHGYINTVVDSYSTDNLQGRTPSIQDIYNNPSYPLLPQLKKTKQSLNPFVEVMRNKFCMTAGSRRSLTINLPGEMYDPCSIALKGISDGAPTTQDGTPSFNYPQVVSGHVPVLDEYTYGVVLACNGQKMTRFFDGKPSAGTPAVPEVPDIPGTPASNPVANTGGFTDWYVWLQPTGGGTSVHPAAGDAYLFSNTQLTTPSPPNFTEPMYLFSGTQAAPPCEFTMSFQGGINPPAGTPVDYTLLAQPVPSTVGGFPMITQPGDEFTQGSVYRCVTAAGVRITCYRNGVPYYMNLECLSTDYVPAVAPIPGDPAVPAGESTLPSELPMGDNHGASLVDYCASYSEHLGSVAYKEAKERSLFDLGQPVAPYLEADTTLPVSVTSSRMILPASDVVRQAQRVTAMVNSSGKPINEPDVSSQSYTAGAGTS